VRRMGEDRSGSERYRGMGEDRLASGRYRGMGESGSENDRQRQAEKEGGTGGKGDDSGPPDRTDTPNFWTTDEVLREIFFWKKEFEEAVGAGGFTGVMLVGTYVSPDEIPYDGPLDSEGNEQRNFLCIDMKEVGVYWSNMASSNWQVDSIPASAVSGLIVYPVLPHYVEDVVP